MTIGQLLKQYRIESLKIQKEWAGNVISPSYYSKVEKDQHRITADDLIALLHFNNVKLWDFFSKLSQEDKIQYNEGLNIDQEINEAYYHNDKKKLNNIKSLVEQSGLVDKEERLLYINAYIAILNNGVADLDDNIVQKMKEKVFSIADFDINSLGLYCNFMSFYDLDSNLFISKKALKQFVGASDIKTQKVVLSIVINILVLSVQNKRFEETDFFFNVANQITTKPEIFFYKLVISAFENIIKYHYESKNDYLEKIDSITSSIVLAGMKSYGRELKELAQKSR